MTKVIRCPNCDVPIAGHPENGCVLAACIGVISDRGELSEAKIRRLFTDTDPDLFWSEVGDLIDRLEDGEFSIKRRR